ncbi:hypothetical protein [Clostridium estertheticum]|uniref:Uncharacterized protein n=1 Tax=Clostridium estertheticum TaxID=238834 RepID=A0AA47ELG6_9CLOT|nr:hypothetical protein [Clostridium estertheticum]MBU3155152.1 hypothetical protein [Clostridium estertheticum]WAG61206.1 hypothetical protein LL038_02855 [Clostridium estertheticum]
MSRLKKLAYPAENNEFIYVPKRVIDFISKGAIITDQHVEGSAGGKLVLKYESKTGSSHGTMEINDMGPDIIKNKKSKEEI